MLDGVICLPAALPSHLPTETLSPLVAMSCCRCTSAAVCTDAVQVLHHAVTSPTHCQQGELFWFGECAVLDTWHCTVLKACVSCVVHRIGTCDLPTAACVGSVSSTASRAFNKRNMPRGLCSQSERCKHTCLMAGDKHIVHLYCTLQHGRGDPLPAAAAHACGNSMQTNTHAVLERCWRVRPVVCVAPAGEPSSAAVPWQCCTGFDTRHTCWLWRAAACRWDYDWLAGKCKPAFLRTRF
jgi:hypothetical protein